MRRCLGGRGRHTCLVELAALAATLALVAALVPAPAQDEELALAEEVLKLAEEELVLAVPLVTPAHRLSTMIGH